MKEREELWVLIVERHPELRGPDDTESAVQGLAFKGARQALDHLRGLRPYVSSPQLKLEYRAYTARGLLEEGWTWARFCEGGIIATLVRVW